MKKYTPLLFILVFLIGQLLPNALCCKEVPLQRAMAVANTIFAGSPGVRSESEPVQLLWDSNSIGTNTKSEKSAPAFYVFVPSGSKGFAIISGDDVIEPVLGYSLKENAPIPDDLPDALLCWLTDIENHIETARNNGTAADESTSLTWSMSHTYREGKLLETALWKQSAPFNNECPVYNGKRTITGCVATATGIIMRYHKWPDAGRGSTTYYTTEENKINVGARNLEAPYDWENMLMSYPKNGYTDTQAKAVARLLADIGAAYQADYGTGETSASTDIKELYHYFKYDPGMSIIARKDYFEKEFDNILRLEIDSGRPVLYAGKNEKGAGHAFVFDGYDNAGMFHINWGWGGSSNGYFAITKHEYSISQRAYINIRPQTGNNNTPEYWITFYNKGMVSDIVDTENYNTSDYFSLKLLLNNRNPLDFKGYIRAGVTDRNGRLKYWAMDERSFELDGRLKENGKTYKSVIVNCILSQEPSIGDKLRLYYRSGESDWKIVMTDPIDWNDVKWELPIADPLYIRESTSIKYENTRKRLTIAYKKGVKAAIIRDGSEIADGVASDSIKTVVDLTRLQGGKYTIRLEKKKELEEIDFSVETK